MIYLPEISNHRRYKVEDNYFAFNCYYDRTIDLVYCSEVTESVRSEVLSWSGMIRNLKSGPHSTPAVSSSPSILCVLVPGLGDDTVISRWEIGYTQV